MSEKTGRGTHERTYSLAASSPNAGEIIKSFVYAFSLEGRGELWNPASKVSLQVPDILLVESTIIVSIRRILTEE